MRNLPKGIHATFTSTCHVCGAKITVTSGKQDPHECRIEIPGQPVTLADIRAALENRT